VEELLVAILEPFVEIFALLWESWSDDNGGALSPGAMESREDLYPSPRGLAGVESVMARYPPQATTGSGG
jgi:hypothetical protein